MLYKNWLDEWLETFVKSKIKERSYLKYKKDIVLHIIPCLGNYNLNDLSTLVLQKFIVNLASQNLSASTINGIITILKGSLKSAFSFEIIDKNYSNLMVRPKINEKQVSCFTEKEQKIIETFILKNRKTRLYGIIICLYTGLRIGELLALKWSDIDLKKKIMFVNKTCRDSWKNGKYFKILDEPKTNNSLRIIPLPKTIVKLLKEIKLAGHHDYVVYGRTKHGSEIRTYQSTFEKLLRKLNIEHKGFHSIRHTFATRAIENGMDIKTLSEILGHKNPEITLKRYAHSMLEYKTEMMNKLGKLLQI